MTQAGIAEFPCQIAENLTPREQMSIMLEENMQRNDLTIWEQANGFQMMLDLGETEERHRRKDRFLQNNGKAPAEYRKAQPKGAAGERERRGIPAVVKGFVRDWRRFRM